MEHIWDLVIVLVPYLATFLIGLLAKSPIYQKGKMVGKEVFDALDDDKVTPDEVQKIYDAWKGKK